MAYLRPNAIQRHVFNPAWSALGLGGTETLAVRGRKSGKTLTLPVIPLEVDGVSYLVSPRGEAEWVRNLRAAGGACELRSRKHGTRALRASEVPVDEREPILVAYRQKAGAAVKGYFARLPDAADHPTFRLDPSQ